jgi:hypothetical protein
LHVEELPWDADRYAEAVKNTIEKEGEESSSNEKLAAHFLQAELGVIGDPAVVTDMFGKILIWYLPGIFPHRVVCFS